MIFPLRLVPPEIHPFPALLSEVEGAAQPVLIPDPPAKSPHFSNFGIVASLWPVSVIAGKL